MSNKELINSMKDLTAALLVNTIFQTKQIKPETMDNSEQNIETVRAILKMWKNMREMVD